MAARDPHFFADMAFRTTDPTRSGTSRPISQITSNLSKAGFETKISSLEQHLSQLESTMGITSDQDTTGHAQFVADIHDAAAKAGELLGTGPAEAFYRLTDV